MQITEKYRPKSATEFIGDPTLITDVKNCVQNEIPVLLTGKPGIGKTSLAFVVANELGYTIIETNASDERKKEHLSSLESRLKMNHFVKTLYLIDEVDGVKNQERLAQIVKVSKHPVILTANDAYKISMKIKRAGKHFPMRPPGLYAIVRRIKQIAKSEGIKVEYDKVTTDIRASINNTFGQSDGYKEEINSFEKTKDVFRSGKLNDVPLIWLLDNAHHFYSGYNLPLVIKLISLADSTGRRELLECLPRATSGNPTYPYYLKRRTGV